MSDAYAQLEKVLGWLAWVACLIAVARLIWLGGMFFQAKNGHSDYGIETIVAQLVGVVMIGSAGAIAGVLLSG